MSGDREIVGWNITGEIDQPKPGDIAKRMIDRNEDALTAPQDTKLVPNPDYFAAEYEFRNGFPVRLHPDEIAANMLEYERLRAKLP